MAVNELMVDIGDTFGLSQLVLEPTRKRNTLDLVFTTVPDLVSNINVISGMSDHEAVTFQYDHKADINKKKPRKVYIFKKADHDAIKNDLENFRYGF